MEAVMKYGAEAWCEWEGRTGAGARRPHVQVTGAHLHAGILWTVHRGQPWWHFRSLVCAARHGRGGVGSCAVARSGAQAGGHHHRAGDGHQRSIRSACWNSWLSWWGICCWHCPEILPASPGALQGSRVGWYAEAGFDWQQGSFSGSLVTRHWFVIPRALLSCDRLPSLRLVLGVSSGRACADLLWIPEGGGGALVHGWGRCPLTLASIAFRFDRRGFSALTALPGWEERSRDRIV